MQCSLAEVVRQIDGEHLDAGQSGSELGGARLVRPVAEADDQRPLVEPERVTALGKRGRGQLGGNRDAGRLEVGPQRLDLAPSGLLSRPQEDRARVRDERGIEDVNRVGVPVGDLRGDDDLGSGLLQCLAKTFVLVRDPLNVRLREPPILTPAREIGRRAAERGPAAGCRSSSGSRAEHTARVSPLP